MKPVNSSGNAYFTDWSPVIGNATWTVRNVRGVELSIINGRTTDSAHATLMD